MFDTQHELKTWPEYFQDIMEGSKTFEVRKNDRNYEVGDTLLLREYDPGAKEYTGSEITVRVHYILNGGQFGIEKGFIVMSVH